MDNSGACPDCGKAANAWTSHKCTYTSPFYPPQSPPFPVEEAHAVTDRHDAHALHESSMECKVCGAEVTYMTDGCAMPDGWGFVLMPDAYHPDARAWNPAPMSAWYACPDCKDADE